MKRKVSLCLFLVFIFISLSSVGAQENDVIKRGENVDFLKETIDAIPMILKYVKALQDFFAKQNNGSAEEIFGNSSEPLGACEMDITYTINSLMKQDWAFKMLDSAGKPASGVLKGATKWYGDYDGCLAVKVPPFKLSNYNSEGFKGRYCLAQLGPLEVGICAPSTCNGQQMNQSLNHIKNFMDNLPLIGNMLNILPAPSSVKCYPEPEEVRFSSATIGCISLLVIICFIVVTATVYDTYVTYIVPAVATKSIQEGPAVENPGEEKSMQISNSNDQTSSSEVILQKRSNRLGKLIEVWLAFSVIGNAKSILDCSAKEGQLDCVHGIRFLSLSWVILGHTFSMSDSAVSNRLDMLFSAADYWSEAVMQSTFSVDTFFLLSGFLMTYLMLRSKTAMKWTSWVYFYVHRYVRLTPVYMIIIFVYSTLWNYFSNGPRSGDPAIQEKTNPCATLWWYNILYINNLLDGPQCMTWAWYLGHDMQYYVISPLFLFWLKSSKSKYRIVGLLVIFALLLASLIATGILSANHNFPIFLHGIAPDDPKLMQTVGEEFSVIYQKPWTRIGPYLIGALLGYLVVETKRLKWKMHLSVVLIGWVVAIAVNMTLVYGVNNTRSSVGVSAFFNSISRTLWASTVGWIIYACVTNNGGPINKLLSWPFFFPLSRLTYSAYLVHPLVIAWFMSSLRSTFYFNAITMGVHYIAFVAITYAMAFLVSVVLEGPVMRIEKILRK